MMKQPNPTAKFDKLRKQPILSFNLSLIPYEIHCGRHSGFPDCCIKFYVTKWIWYDADSKFRKNHIKLLKKYVWTDDSVSGYIVCPKCIKSKTFVEVKKCPKGCRMKILLWGRDWWKKRKHND